MRLCVRFLGLAPDYCFQMTENDVARVVVGGAFRVHSTLGPGLLESVYQAALSLEVARSGLRQACQIPVPVVYGDITLGLGFRADILVEEKVVIEIKSVETTLPVNKKQLLTYLRLMDKRLGLLINFNVALIKNGILRVVNGLED